MRLLKILLGVTGTMIGIFLLATVVLYSSISGTIRASDYATFDDLPLNTWTTVDLSEQAVCSDNSDYRIYTRRGESENLIIHFAGGGACWNAETCGKPITITDMNGYYFPFIWEIIRAILNGIFAQQNPANPFEGWNVAYFPYCTGDFHIGTVTNSYSLPDGSTVSIHHNGRQNISEALDWVYANFDAPETLLISGESAGAFGTLFWTRPIAEHYSTSNIYQLADGAFLQTDQWREILNDVWQANTLENYGFEVEDDIVRSAYDHFERDPLPNVTYMHVNTLYDGVLTYFNSVLEAVPLDDAYREAWSQAMRATMQAIAESGLNYNFFLTDYGRDEATGATPHTAISFELFYQMNQDGVPLSEWVRRIIEGERLSIGAEFLDD